MRNNFDYDVLILSLCALFLMMFSLVLIFHFNGLFTGLAHACLSIYFALVAWRKIAKSNNVFFSCLVFIALALAFEVGFSLAYITVVLIVFTVMVAIHHFLSPSDKRNKNFE